jgi:predicted DNA-binding antitoxin AbrB/MazE fold protein
MTMVEVIRARPAAVDGQEMAKGRRTEIEYLNGFVLREGERVGIPARANERLVDIVKRVERGELKQDPRHITELRPELRSVNHQGLRRN